MPSRSRTPSWLRHASRREPLRALLYRRPSRAADHPDRVRPGHLPGQRAPASPARRYTLRIHAATREVILTMPPRGSAARGARRSRRSTAAGSRRGCAGCRRRRRSPTARRAAARRDASHRASARQARHGVDRAAAKAASSCSASPATRRIVERRVGDFLRREAQRDLDAASRRCADALGVTHQAHLGARPVEPLGLVLDNRRAVVFLAADPGAALRAGLSRRPRGRASGRDEPLAAVLAAGEPHLPGLPSAPRSGSTRTAPTCTATACRPRAPASGTRSADGAIPAGNRVPPCFRARAKVD